MWAIVWDLNHISFQYLLTLLLLSHLNTRLQLSAAVGQDAESQVQSFPGALWLPEQVQQGPETTLSPESGDASLVTLDVLRPDSNQSSPLRDFGSLVHFSATAWVCFAMFSPWSGFGEVSQAPGQRGLRWWWVPFFGVCSRLFPVTLHRWCSHGASARCTTGSLILMFLLSVNTNITLTVEHPWRPPVKYWQIKQHVLSFFLTFKLITELMKCDLTVFIHILKK